MHLSDEGAVPSWHVQRLTLLEASTTVARGLRRGLGLELTTTLRHVRARIRFEDLSRLPFTPPDGDIHHRNENLTGLGDPQLSLHLARTGVWNAAARAGLSIPLGRTEENPFELGHHGLPHQHIQFGTGTWDPVLGAALGRRLGEFGLTLSGMARLPLYENGHGFRAGNRYAASAAADRGLGAAWRGTAALELVREEAERWSGRIEEEGNLGRTDFLLGLGVGRAFPPLGLLSLAAHIPLRTRATGSQLDYPVLIALQWSR